MKKFYLKSDYDDIELAQEEWDAIFDYLLSLRAVALEEALKKYREMVDDRYDVEEVVNRVLDK